MANFTESDLVVSGGWTRMTYNFGSNDIGHEFNPFQKYAVEHLYAGRTGRVVRGLSWQVRQGWACQAWYGMACLVREWFGLAWRGLDNDTNGVPHLTKPSLNNSLPCYAIA